MSRHTLRPASQFTSHGFPQSDPWATWFENTIYAFTSRGYKLAAKTRRKLKFIKPKEHDLLLMLVSFMLGIIPLVMYFLHYSIKKPQTTTIVVRDDGSVIRRDDGGSIWVMDLLLGLLIAAWVFGKFYLVFHILEIIS